MPRFRNLEQWLAWQETLHPRTIDPGLDRVAHIATRMGLRQPDSFTVTVAGTNGKGSSVALLEAILMRAGYRVCSYTSPHLLRYNERLRIAGVTVDDAALCTAFAAIDRARGDATLTYFEFGTLAALAVFREQDPDIMLLEVGMGGRLDAVNVVDADVALVTTIGLDHTEWLGHTREAIAVEKAGIFRQGRPAVCSDPDAPDSLRQTALATGAHWYGLNEQYRLERYPDHWNWYGTDRSLDGLPRPALAGDSQLHNAAGVLMVLDAMRGRFPVERSAIETGLLEVRLPGRFQVLPGDPLTILDVAHNPQGARELAHTLQQQACGGRTLVILGMLQDKDVAGFTENLAAVADMLYLAGLDTARGLSAGELRKQVSPVIDPARLAVFTNVGTAIRHARQSSGAGDRIVVCGSFYTVAEAMAGAV